MWVFRALSTKALATEKTAEEEKEASSKGLPVSLYKRISRIGAQKRSAVAELEGWINEGKKQPKKLELKRMVKELRKYSRHEHALEVFFSCFLCFLFTTLIFYFVISSLKTIGFIAFV